MKAVLKYPGAKNRLANWIVDHIPEHKVYCEPFFGSGAVFFNKEICYNEILNDLDDEVYNFFKVLRNNGEQHTLEKAIERLKNAQIENKDALELIESLNGKQTFIYIDPPYLLETRKKYLYEYEMADDEHIKLLEMIKEKRCKIMISGYENELYETYLKGWRKTKKKTHAECSVSRTETLWMNYDFERQLTI